MIPNELSQKTVDVTIVLNIWKRNYIKEQMIALLSQIVLPKEIWVLHYENYVEIQEYINEVRKVFPNIFLFISDKNLMFFGRHSIAISANTKFIWVLDDDVIPGVKWLNNCVKKCDFLNAIITCSGRIIQENTFRPESFLSSKAYIGDFSNKGSPINLCSKDTMVDYGCNSYFFKKEWISAFWNIWPITFLTGDDIHLSAALKIKLNIATVVLKQTDESNSGNLKRKYGVDDVASWRTPGFMNTREEVFQYHILRNNWIPLLWKK